MALRIEETFEVQAPVSRVWAFLNDPRQVVTCLPGAELTEIRDDRSFAGRIRVKVGPVTAGYSGTAQLAEVDDAAHRVRLVGEGRETSGPGSARLAMSSTLVELPSGATRVQVEAEVDVVGKIVQFGRGLMEEVARQIFRQFSACAQQKLAQEPATAAGGDASDAAEPRDSAATAAPPEPIAPALATAAPADTGAAARPAAAPGPTATTAGTAPQRAEAVPVLSLLLRAVIARLRHLLGRLFGRPA